MITPVKSFKASNGVLCATVEAAQDEEIGLVALKHGLTDDEAKVFTKLVRDCAIEIIDILTTTTSSRPKNRKVNGGKRRTKAEMAAAKAAEATT